VAETEDRGELPESGNRVDGGSPPIRSGDRGQRTEEPIVGAPEQTANDQLLGRSVRALLDSRRQLGPSDIFGMVDTARDLLGAERLRCTSRTMG
jgi:hypothetical protein